VRSMADRALVMYLGGVLETAATEDLFRAPRHPYTRALIDSIPTLDRNRRPKPLEGELPSSTNPPPGCPFAGRCPRVFDRCRVETPELVMEGNRGVACFDPLPG
jgi:oligopeptide/dipeptide ABC transporter ATP-binding protein